MLAAIHLLNTLLPMLYAVAAMNYSIDFFRDDPFARRMTRPLLGAVLASHTTYLVLRIAAFGHVPLASLAEVLTCVALAVAVVYATLEWATRNQRTGMFVMIVPFGFQTLASAFISDEAKFPEILKSPLFGLHTSTAVLGYTAFAVSAIYGVLYLMLYHDLKASRFGLVYRRLPPLDVLARMSLRAATLGIVFLSVTILAGMLWATQRSTSFAGDPKFITTLIVWTVYGAGLGLHYGLHWTGRRTIAVTLIGFTIMVVSLIAVRLWFTTFHVFA